MTTAIKPIDDFRSTLTKMESQFKMALPAHVPPEKFMRVVVTAVQNNGELLQADRNSLFSACMRAAQDGLLPDGREAALVMFKDKAQYMPMVAGILKKVRNSGELASITSQIVYKNDKFKFWIDTTGENLDHEPVMFGDRGDAIGVYALAKTKDGAVYIETMNRDEVMKIRAASRSKTGGPWAGPFEHEMWRKSAIRRLAKRLPMSTDLEMTVTADDEMYDLDKSETAAPAQTKSSRLAAIVEEATPKEPVEVKSEQHAVPLPRPLVNPNPPGPTPREDDDIPI